MKRISTRIVPLLLALLFFVQPGHAAQDSRNGLPSVPVEMKRAVAVRATGSIQVDGLLNESAWQSSPSIGEMLQREPREGVPATENTEVRLLFDETNLYIGVICYDSGPEGIIGTQMSRDGDLSVDDRIEILLDTFLDRRNAFYFSTNPAGALVDGLIIENSQQINREWDAIWDVRVVFPRKAFVFPRERRRV